MTPIRDVFPNVPSRGIFVNSIAKERLVRFRRARQQGSLTAEERKLFLSVLGRGGSVQAAAQAAGRDRQRFYDLRNRDLDFRSHWERAEGERSSMVFDRRPTAVESVLDNSPYPEFPRDEGETETDFRIRHERWQDALWRKSLEANGQLWRPFTWTDALLDRDDGPLSSYDGRPRYVDPHHASDI